MTDKVTLQQLEDLHIKGAELIVTSVEFVATKTAEFLLQKYDQIFNKLDTFLEENELIA